MLQRHRTNRIHTYTYIYIERRREEGGKGEIYFKELTDMSIVAGNSKIHKLAGWTFR